ncbi:MAG: hypothetical protein JSU63_03455 [Phycisphaerales bacterium]|nr:MAG: hypothetical protein JSU63_03455 [Phycisphaerales bacterium]
MQRKCIVEIALTVSVVVTAMGIGCGANASFFNPAFVNTNLGGQFPLTPGPGAAFILVRCVNETGDVAEFTVTVEREVFVIDEEGLRQFDDLGNPVTTSERETVRLTTFAAPPANELGVLFSCSPEPVNIIGLGENLLPSDAAVYVGGQGAGGAAGAGVSAADVNPLSRTAGNFGCGDTVIFRAFTPGGLAGGSVSIQSLLLPGYEQPSIFAGPDTFTNLSEFLESQVREDG